MPVRVTSDTLAKSLAFPFIGSSHVRVLAWSISRSFLIALRALSSWFLALFFSRFASSGVSVSCSITSYPRSWAYSFKGMVTSLLGSFVLVCLKSFCWVNIATAVLSSLSVFMPSVVCSSFSFRITSCTPNWSIVALPVTPSIVALRVLIKASASVAFPCAIGKYAGCGFTYHSDTRFSTMAFMRAVFSSSSARAFSCTLRL